MHETQNRQKSTTAEFSKHRCTTETIEEILEPKKAHKKYDQEISIGSEDSNMETQQQQQQQYENGSRNAKSGNREDRRSKEKRKTCDTPRKRSSHVKRLTYHRIHFDLFDNKNIAQLPHMKRLVERLDGVSATYNTFSFSFFFFLFFLFFFFSFFLFSLIT